jgi:hypothetical protein
MLLPAQPCRLRQVTGMKNNYFSEVLKGTLTVEKTKTNENMKNHQFYFAFLRGGNNGGY